MKHISKIAISKGVGAAFIALVGGFLVGVHPILGGLLCILGFVLSAIILIQGEVEKAVRDEQLESVTRILFDKGLGNAPHDAFEKALSETGNSAAVLKHLEDALRLDPDNPRYNAEMAVYFALLVSRRVNCGLDAGASRITRGKMHAEQSLAKGGHNTVAYVAFGMLLDNEGRHTEAQECFLKAGKMGNPWYHVYLCTSYGMAGDFDRALQEIEQYNNEGLSAVWVVRLCRGRTLLRVGRYREAEAELQIALRMRGAYPGLALSLSDAIYMQGRFLAANRYKMREVILLLAVNPKRSIRLFTEVILHGTIHILTAASRSLAKLFHHKPVVVRLLTRIMPPYEPYATLSEMAFSRGHITEAYDLLQRALVFGENEPRLWVNLSAICMGLGHYSDASAACARALVLEPDNMNWQQQAKSIEAVVSGSAPLHLFSVSEQKGKDGAVVMTDADRITVRKRIE